MKANAPEKIYLTTNENNTHYYTEGIPFEREYVEYIRKDAIIEKAEGWLREVQKGFILTDKDITDFINYMKG